MKNTSIQIAVFLISHYGILSAHLVDIHIPSGEEHVVSERVDRERENERSFNVLDDDSASYQQKEEAFQNLVENEEIL